MDSNETVSEILGRGASDEVSSPLETWEGLYSIIFKCILFEMLIKIVDLFIFGIWMYILNSLGFRLWFRYCNKYVLYHGNYFLSVNE